jgi:hypothetical protein
VTDQRLSDILEIECAVLQEIASDLAEDGMDEHARRIRESLAILDTELEPVEKIKLIVPILRPVDYALHEAKLDELAKGLRRIRRRLAHEADRLLVDTQKLNTGEYKPVE